MHITTISVTLRRLFEQLALCARFPIVHNYDKLRALLKKKSFFLKKTQF